MVQIQQTVQATFSSLSFEDAIVMVPLMDELAERFRKAHANYQEKLDEPSEKRSKWDYDNQLRKLRKEYLQLGHQLHTLETVGFRTSMPGMIQYVREDFPEFFNVYELAA